MRAPPPDFRSGATPFCSAVRSAVEAGKRRAGGGRPIAVGSIAFAE